MKYKNIIIAVLAGLLPIIGVIVGSYLTYKNSQNLFVIQRQVELREKSYSEIMGIKRQIIQSFQTLAEAKILIEYYDFRFKYISGDTKDLEIAKDEFKRMLNLIPEFSLLQRELLESLGNVRISYKLNSDLQTLNT